MLRRKGSALKWMALQIALYRHRFTLQPPCSTNAPHIPCGAFALTAPDGRTFCCHEMIIRIAAICPAHVMFGGVPSGVTE